jgi:ABC-type antimicrobial peptide transport system permease subunit
MAAVGIYGLIQYSISTRTQEIGLRMAIGARAGDIFFMILGEGLALSLTGLALGLVGAWWLGRAVSSLLFRMTASDPLTFTTVSLLLTIVAIAACYFPARRAMKVDPTVALRVTIEAWNPWRVFSAGFAGRTGCRPQEKRGCRSG